MTDIDLYYGEMLPPRHEPGGKPETEGVLVGTASPVSLRVEEVDHHLTPGGTVCIGSFLGRRLIGRCAVPEETAEEFLGMELFERPVALALNVRRGGPGIEANLLALVPMEERETGDEEPWKGSVPGSGYDAAAHGEGEAETDGQLVGVFLGQVVRFGEDRKHPDSLVKEAADMLARVVRGRIGNVVDRVLDDLTAPEP